MPTMPASASAIGPVPSMTANDTLRKRVPPMSTSFRDRRTEAGELTGRSRQHSARGVDLQSKPRRPSFGHCRLPRAGVEEKVVGFPVDRYGNREIPGVVSENGVPRTAVDLIRPPGKFLLVF